MGGTQLVRKSTSKDDCLRLLEFAEKRCPLVCWSPWKHSRKLFCFLQRCCLFERHPDVPMVPPKSEHCPCCWNLQECILQSTYVYWKFQWKSIHGGMRSDSNGETNKTQMVDLLSQNLNIEPPKKDDLPAGISFWWTMLVLWGDLGWVLQPNMGILGSVTSTSQLE